MKQNDTSPDIEVDLVDANEEAVNLTGATIKFFTRVEPKGAVKVNGSAATIVTATAGTVKYSWVSGNTDTADDYEAEFEVTFSGGGVQTFPGRNYILVHIIDDIG
jgi:hypothetical protein